MCWKVRIVKSTVFFTCDQIFGALIHLNLIILMPGVNYVIYGWSSPRTTPGLSLYQSLTLQENIVAVFTQNRVIYNNLKRQISYWSKKFQLLPNSQFFHGKYFFSWLGRFMYKLGLFINHSWKTSNFEST